MINLNILKTNVEYVNWNNFCNVAEWHEKQSFYGKCIKIIKAKTHTFNCLLATLIPVVYPVFVALAINKFLIREDIKIRYGE